MLMINGSTNSHEISETIDLKETAKPNAKYKLLTALVLAVISAASAAASVLNHPLAITARATVGGAVVLQGIALAAAVSRSRSCCACHQKPLTVWLSAWRLCKTGYGTFSFSK